MLAIFSSNLAHPPAELKSPSTQAAANPPEEVLSKFIARSPSESASVSFGDVAILATDRGASPIRIQKLFCGYDEIYCLFEGSVNNLCALNKQYGLTKSANEAMLMIEVYRTLRDRGPYPADQVVKDLDGSFGFVVYDSERGSVFTALGADGAVKLYWGVGEGHVIISDNLEVVEEGCGKSYAPFPPGFIFHSEGGLMSFEHPMHKVKAVARVDSEGTLCGSNFRVDVYTRINSIPRRGSQANWTEWDPRD